ncbi:hypothetical protein EV192_11463 [Actinocrispum wychmicini]|uniref:Uncharacterized protein n=1 Tax=Actinocrispum wychmicini TaxID=1213861 RepID=A0A4R2IWR0_9PSEU|nr:hypothetical protein EV192_11463 [Actinocrispum wychmicini]
MSCRAPPDPGGCDLPSNPLHAIHTTRNPAASGTVPARASPQPHHRPQSGRAQTGPGLAVLGIGDQPAIPHRPSGPPRSAVQHRIGIGHTERAGPRDLNGLPVIQMPRHRPPDRGDADQHTVLGHTHSELHPPRRTVMPVVRLDERARLPERHRHNRQAAHPTTPTHTNARERSVRVRTLTHPTVHTEAGSTRSESGPGPSGQSGPGLTDRDRHHSSTLGPGVGAAVGVGLASIAGIVGMGYLPLRNVLTPLTPDSDRFLDTPSQESCSHRMVNDRCRAFRPVQARSRRHTDGAQDALGDTQVQQRVLAEPSRGSAFVATNERVDLCAGCVMSFRSSLAVRSWRQSTTVRGNVAGQRATARGHACGTGARWVDRAGPGYATSDLVARPSAGTIPGFCGPGGGRSCGHPW